MSLQYLDALKALGASPSTKLVVPAEFTNLLRPFIEHTNTAQHTTEAASQVDATAEAAETSAADAANAASSSNGATPSGASAQSRP
jgi:hypothetical protein